MQTLRQGGIVGIFPEGRLPVKGEYHPFAPSTALIALRAGAVIVPMVTDGSYGLFKRAHVLIGKPMDLRTLTAEERPSSDELARLTLLLEQRNAELLEHLARRMEGRHGKR